MQRHVYIRIPVRALINFDWEGRKINGNRKKTPRKCPFQGRNLKVTTPEEGRGKEKVETCSVAVPSEVGFFWVQWRSSPHNLDQYRGKIEFSTLLADLRRHLNTIPHLRSLLQVSHDPNPRKKTPAEQYWRFPGAAKMLQLAKDLEIFHLTRHAKERKDRSSTSFSPPFELFLRQHRSSAVPRRLSLFFCRYGIAMTSNMVAVPQQQTCQLGSSMLFFCLTLLAAVVDERRTVDLFSHFCHIVDGGNHRSTCTSGLFGLCLCIGGFTVDFLSALRPADIACEPGKFLRKLLLRVYDRPLPISVSDRSHPALWSRWATFSQKRCPSIDLFSVVELPLTDGGRHVWSIVTACAVAPLASWQNAPSLYLGAWSRHGLSSFYS